MNRTHSAFTIIEVLIAMLVLFTAITFSNISIKAFNSYQRQASRYQDIYVTALSLKEKISSYSKFTSSRYSGDLNGIAYVVDIKELIKKRNYFVGQDGMGKNNGDFMITLYELNMTLTKNSKEKNYKFLLTKQKKI